MVMKYYVSFKNNLFPRQIYQSENKDETQRTIDSNIWIKLKHVNLFHLLVHT